MTIRETPAADEQEESARRLAPAFSAVTVVRARPDPDGARLTAALAPEGVDVTGVRARADGPTGVAQIAVDSSGANTIIVAQARPTMLAREYVLARARSAAGGGR